jgi:hypothetical protein
VRVCVCGRAKGGERVRVMILLQKNLLLNPTNKKNLLKDYNSEYLKIELGRIGS